MALMKSEIYEGYKIEIIDHVPLIRATGSIGYIPGGEVRKVYIDGDDLTHFLYRMGDEPDEIMKKCRDWIDGEMEEIASAVDNSMED